MALTVRFRHARDFIQAHQAEWDRLDFLAEKLAGTSSSLSPAELDELWTLYRKVSAQFAYAQTYFPGHEVTERLRRSVIRSHNLLYGAAKKGVLKRLVKFFAMEFPLLIHERFVFFLTAFFIVLAGSLLAFGFTWMDFSYAAYFLPEGLEAFVKPEDAGTPVDWNHAIASGEIMVNNITVAFNCFAFGILLGIGTVWVLFSNGMALGALGAYYSKSGVGYEFFAFIWPHGVIEFAAIFISGAAGLALAYRFFVPGDLTRKEALIREGLVTIKLMLGVVPMFVIAAIIEGYVTPLGWPHWTKYLVAFVTLLFLVMYFGWPIVKHGTSNERNPV